MAHTKAIFVCEALELKGPVVTCMHTRKSISHLSHTHTHVAAFDENCFCEQRISLTLSLSIYIYIKMYLDQTPSQPDVCALCVCVRPSFVYTKGSVAKAPLKLSQLNIYKTRATNRNCFTNKFNTNTLSRLIQDSSEMLLCLLGVFWS